MAQPFITVDHVSYTYPAGENETAFPAVRDISFSVERGAFVAILGHNGSGKSTLAKLLNMILVPDSGTITVDVRDDLFLVHCLDSSFADGIDDSEMQKRVCHLEKEGKDRG